MHACPHASSYTHMHIHMHIQLHVYTCIYIHLHTYIPVGVDIYLEAYLCMSVYVRLSTYRCVPVCIHSCIHCHLRTPGAQTHAGRRLGKRRRGATRVSLSGSAQCRWDCLVCVRGWAAIECVVCGSGLLLTQVGQLVFESPPTWNATHSSLVVAPDHDLSNCVGRTPRRVYKLQLWGRCIAGSVVGHVLPRVCLHCAAPDMRLSCRPTVPPKPGIGALVIAPDPGKFEKGR